MIQCHLAALMARDKLKVSDVARVTGVNRSTISALSRGMAVRVELPAVEQLCLLFHCQVGDIFQLMTPDDRDSR